LSIEPLYLNYDDAGRVAGISGREVRRRVARGELRAYRVGRLVRIALADLVAWLERQPEVTQ
jgi:excisionase family DNA binding protein